MKSMIALIILCLFVISVVFADDTYEQGKRLFNDGQFENALEIFEKIIDDNENNAEANHWLGKIHLRLGHTDEASEYCEKAVELDEKNAEYHYLYGQALAREVQEASVFRQPFLAPKILKEFERTIELDSSHIGGYLGAATYYLNAPGIMGGDLDNAKLYAEKVIGKGSTQGHFIIIGILEKEEKFTEAEQEYEALDKTYKNTKDNYGFYNRYGYFLLRQKKYDLAIEKFKRQVELAPDSLANPYDSLGDGYRAAGRLNEALKAYQKAVEIDPAFEASIKNIEEIKKELGQ
jgi:tetratricopeptide (TPR) repeat protein